MAVGKRAVGARKPRGTWPVGAFQGHRPSAVRLCPRNTACEALRWIGTAGSLPTCDIFTGVSVMHMPTVRPGVHTDSTTPAPSTSMCPWGHVYMCRFMCPRAMCPRVMCPCGHVSMCPRGHVCSVSAGPAPVPRSGIRKGRPVTARGRERLRLHPDQRVDVAFARLAHAGAHPSQDGEHALVVTPCRGCDGLTVEGVRAGRTRRAAPQRA